MVEPPYFELIIANFQMLSAIKTVFKKFRHTYVCTFIGDFVVLRGLLGGSANFGGQPSGAIHA